MLDLTKYGKALPSTVTVGGFVYPIKTDFKVWLDFGKFIREENPRADEVDIFFVGFAPEDKQEAFNKLFEFYQPKKELPRPSRNASSEIVFDYDYDSDLVFAAFMQQYHIDLLETKMHWHKYLALFDALQNTMFNSVVGFRSYNPSDKTSYEASQKELKRQWELPQKQTKEDKELLDHFNSFEKK